MRDLKLLLKNYFNVYIGNFQKRKNKGKYISGTAIVLFSGLLFIFLFTEMAMGTISQAIRIGEPELGLYVQIMMSFVFMFLLIILNSTNNRRENDTDLLLSLPFKKRTVILAKIIKNFILDLFTIILTLMPGFVVYYILVDTAPVTVIIYGLIFALLLACFANGIATILKAIVVKTTRKFKYGDLIQSIVTAVIIIVYMSFYIFINTKLANVDSAASDNFYKLWIFELIVNFVLYKKFVSFVIIIALCLTPFIIGILLQDLMFSNQGSSYRSTSDKLIYKKNTVTKSLLKKEAGRYFRTPVYVVNTLTGSFFILLFGVLFFILGTDYLNDAIKNFLQLDIENYIGIIITLLICVLSSTICTTCSSISIEGKQFWILKAHPISEKAIFNSKLSLNLIIGSVSIIITSILIAVRVGFLYLPFLIILPFLFLLFTSINGLYLNLIYNRFDWDNEAEIIKRGMAVFLALIIGIVPGIMLFSVALSGAFKQMNPYLILSIISLLMLLIDYIYYKILMSKGVKKFRSL